MFTVSEDFTDKISAGKRKVVGMVKVYWTDPYFLKDSINYSISCNDVLEGALLQQVLDDSSISTRKWWQLDETTSFEAEIYPAPSTIIMAMAEKARFGWWGKASSQDDGSFSVSPKITIQHLTAKTVFDVLVTGDDAYEEFPVDFKVILYSDEGTYTFNVVDNQLASWRGSVPETIKSQAGTPGHFDFRAVTKMELEISKWSKAGSAVKIVSFTAINETIFNSDDIVSMSLLEELEVTNGGLPIGTASANEIDITFNNIEDKFYSGNPGSELKNVLLPNRKIKPYIGTQLADNVFEYIPLGEYWSMGWNATESSSDITVTARDRMELLRQTKYLGCAIRRDISFYDLAESVLEEARGMMPDVEYEIDENLKTINIPVAYLTVSTFMGALTTIVEACLGHVYIDRKGVIQVCGSKRFIEMKPWSLGEHVWVFDDGEEFIGETCSKVFSTVGWHKGILYITEPETEQVIEKPFFVEVRNTAVENPYRVDLINVATGSAIIGSNFEKVSNVPLKYNLTLNEEGAYELLATIYSESGDFFNSQKFLMEVRSVSEASLFTLESEDDVSIVKLSPSLYNLSWNSSGSKQIRVLVEETEERDLYVEVRPNIQASWLINKED